MARVWIFGENVDTDQIVPGRYAPYMTSEADLPKSAFIEARPEFAKEAKPGDLIISITVQDHPYFARRGDNIYLDVPVTFAEAALGSSVEVPTMDGRAAVRVPAGTQGGTELRLRGKGFPHIKAAGRGDQFVRIEIAVPKNLEPKARDLLREIDSVTQSNPRLGRWN